MAKFLYVLGAGGHSSVLVDVLKENGEKIDAIFSPSRDALSSTLEDIKYFSDEDIILGEHHKDVVLINGIGSLPGSSLRKSIFCKFSEKEYIFKKVISKHAIVSSYAVLGQGVQIMAGAIVQSGAQIGDNSILNTGAIIDHDCKIGVHNHLAPGVTLSGQVTTGYNVHIGTGAVIIQGISIGDNVVIAAGAIVTENIESNKVVFGARANVQNKKVKL